MNSQKLADADILLRLTGAEKNTGVELTYTHKRFFIGLTRLADKLGTLSLELSEQRISEELNVPLRTVTKCMSRLTACGVIKRHAGDNAFPPKPHITEINPGFLFKEGLE